MVVIKGEEDIMEKILVVYGESNTGKTTVINEIYDALSQKEAVVEIPKEQLEENSCDFFGVLKYDNKTVAFLSMGDYRTFVDDYVSKCKKYDVFVTALNKRFSNIGSVWLKNSNAIYKFDKTEPTDADNSKVKKSVISKI